MALMMRPVADLEDISIAFRGQVASRGILTHCIMLADIHCDCRHLAYFAGDVKVDELSAFVLHFDRFVC